MELVKEFFTSEELSKLFDHDDVTEFATDIDDVWLFLTSEELLKLSAQDAVTVFATASELVCDESTYWLSFVKAETTVGRPLTDDHWTKEAVSDVLAVPANDAERTVIDEVWLFLTKLLLSKLFVHDDVTEFATDMEEV